MVRTSPREWRDLILLAVLLVLGLAVVSLPATVRIPLGMLVVLVAPGYALVAALFPDDEHLDPVERLALSLGVSLGLIAVQALVLDRIPGGFSPATIRLAVSGFGLVLVVVAVIRRARSSSGTTRPMEAGRIGDGRAVRFTQAIVVTNVAVAALAFLLTLTASPPTSTAFYVVGEKGLLGDYPRRVAVGQPIVVRVGIDQASDQSGQYQVAVRSGDRVLASRSGISVAPSDDWESDIQFSPDMAGLDQEFVIQLERTGEQEPFRLLRLWLDVTDGEDSQ